MTLKIEAKDWTVKEQIIEDLVSGLSFQFMLDSDGRARLRICGEGVPFGNREFIFGDDGAEAGSGTAVSGPCPLTWIKEVTA